MKVRIQFGIGKGHLDKVLEMSGSEALTKEVANAISWSLSYSDWDKESNIVKRKYPKIKDFKFEVAE